ncbi:MAG: ATP-binding protein [Rhodospirillaceae bacterium]
MTACVDAKRVAQFVSNLVANSLQHGPAESDVAVSAQGGLDTVTVEVHNRGPAIDAALMKKLFDPSPADQMPTTIGLALVFISHGRSPSRTTER